LESSFNYKNTVLHCDDFDLLKFSKTVPTPFYLYSKTEIEKNCHFIHQAGRNLNFLPCYALKANYNPTLLKIICDQGFGADVVSGGELLFALNAGFPAEKIVFAGVGKTRAEIELALNKGIHSLNIESGAELEAIAQTAKKLGKIAKISFRLNPDIDAKTHEYISTGMQTNKFGIFPEEAFQFYKKAAADPFLEPEGIHVHIGSQITSIGPYLETVSFLLDFVKKLKAERIDIKFVDLGGGIGIAYQRSFSDSKTATTFLPDILPGYLDGFSSLDIKLVLELGRSVIGSVGILVSKVLYRKQTPSKTFIIIDAAMNNLIRPSLYDAYHEVSALHLKDRAEEVVDIVGPVCESGDFMARQRSIQMLEPEEFVAIGGAGAYGQALSSNYNLRPNIAEYLVKENSVETICRAQTIQDVIDQYKK